MESGTKDGMPASIIFKRKKDLEVSMRGIQKWKKRARTKDLLQKSKNTFEEGGSDPLVKRLKQVKQEDWI